MGDHRSSPVKPEPNQSMIYHPYTFTTSAPNMSIDNLNGPTQQSRRPSNLAPSDPPREDVIPQQDKVKRQRSTSKSMSVRGALSAAPHLMPGEEITYTPTTHRISKAKKGKKVHSCTFPGCPKIFTRAEHRRRHEANHNAHPAYQCHLDGCRKPFQRGDLLARHMERQHQIPMDASSSRSGPSRGSMSDISSPAVSNARMARASIPNSTTSTTHGVGGGFVGGGYERQARDTAYRTQSVPPSLRDHLSSQSIGTAPYGLPLELLYGPSPTGDSLCSSSDSCYSPPSDFYPAPRPVPSHYSFGPELVQRPHSAVDTTYPSIETSPLSIGPPTPVNGSTWTNTFDPAALGFIPEASCMPQRYYPHTTTTPPWGSTSAIAFQEMAMPPKSEWA